MPSVPAYLFGGPSGTYCCTYEGSVCGMYVRVRPRGCVVLLAFPSSPSPPPVSTTPPRALAQPKSPTLCHVFSTRSSAQGRSSSRTESAMGSSASSAGGRPRWSFGSRRCPCTMPSVRAERPRQRKQQRQRQDTWKYIHRERAGEGGLFSTSAESPRHM